MKFRFMIVWISKTYFVPYLVKSIQPLRISVYFQSNKIRLVEANISELIHLRSLCAGDNIGSRQSWSSVAICPLLVVDNREEP